MAVGNVMGLRSIGMKPVVQEQVDFKPQEWSVGPQQSQPTQQNYGMDPGTSDKYNQSWNEWKNKIAQPGLDSTEQLRMRNQAQAAAQADESRRTKELQDSLSMQGLSGTGFGNAALAQLQSGSRGNIQNELARMDMQNALTADQNLMNLIGLGGNMASDYGNLQLGYSGLNQREGSDFRNFGLDQQQFYNQQYQDYLAQKNMAEDRKREEMLLNKILAEMYSGTGSGSNSGSVMTLGRGW